MKSIILAALVGTLTFDDVMAARVHQMSPASGIAEHAAAVAEKAGNEDKEKANRMVIKAQKGAEQVESVKLASEDAVLRKQVEAKIEAESKIKLKREDQKKLTKEEREEALQKKITEEIKVRKEINEELLEKSLIAKVAGAREDEERHRRLHEERKHAVASIEAETAAYYARAREIGRIAAEARKNLSDMDYINNLPEHHLKGYLGVEDDIQDDEGDDDDEDEDLVGVHDDDVMADEDEEADNQDDDAEADEGEQGEEEEGEEEDSNEAAGEHDTGNALVQKDSGHLHKTSIRVDPPLTADGKKSIEEAEKALDDSKKDYDKLKEKAQDLEFKFKSAARISRHAREQRGEAEDAYYIAAKNARKSMRHAENLARESQQAAAKQAAHDKYNEVISAANNAASASVKKPDTPPAKTGPAKPEAPAAAAQKAPATAPAAPAKPAAK